MFDTFIWKNLKYHFCIYSKNFPIALWLVGSQLGCKLQETNSAKHKGIDVFHKIIFEIIVN